MCTREVTFCRVWRLAWIVAEQLTGAQGVIPVRLQAEVAGRSWRKLEAAPIRLQTGAQRPHKTAKQIHRKEVGGGGQQHAPYVGAQTHIQTDTLLTVSLHTFSLSYVHKHILLLPCTLSRPTQAVRQTVWITAPLPALRATQADPVSASGRGKSGNAAVKGARGGGGEVGRVFQMRLNRTVWGHDRFVITAVQSDGKIAKVDEGSVRCF